MYKKARVEEEQKKNVHYKYIYICKTMTHLSEGSLEKSLSGFYVIVSFM